MPTVLDGIVVGGVGGFVAGISVYFSKYLHQMISDRCDSKKLYNWLQENSSDKGRHQFRSTRAISSWNNLTEDRVRYLCSYHDKIFLSTGEKEDIWGIHGRERKSVKEDHDPTVL